MPFTIAERSKRELRQDVSQLLGDWMDLETSSIGNAGGTTAIFASLSGMPISSIVNKYLFIREGTNDTEWRPTSAFTASDGTTTVRRAYTGQVATLMSANLFEFSPALYTIAINEAIRQCYPACYRAILHHTFIREPGLQRTIPLPRNMERVMRLMEDARSSEALRDYFDRSASTTAPGSKWTSSVGDWGITSESLYAPGDTDADRLLAATNPQVKNGVIQFVVRGDTTDTASRVLSALFRYEDASNYLFVRLLNGQVQLRKRDAGTDSSLATGTVTTTENVDYVVRVLFDGSWIRVWVDDVEYITFELLGLDLKYLGYNESGTGTFGNVGFRLDKAGTPSLGVTSTLVRDYFCHELVGRVERGDWKRSYDGRMVELNTLNRGWSVSEGRMLWLEGMAPLSTLTADTTFEALASDTTDVVEIQATDPAYEVLIYWAKYVMLREAASSTWTNNPEKRAEYAERAREALAEAQAIRARKRMRQFTRSWG